MCIGKQEHNLQSLGPSLENLLVLPDGASGIRTKEYHEDFNVMLFVGSSTNRCKADLCCKLRPVLVHMIGCYTHSWVLCQVPFPASDGLHGSLAVGYSEDQDAFISFKGLG